MEYYSSMKIMQSFTTWMKPEDIMISDVRQAVNNKYCMISLTCGILKAVLIKVENGTIVIRD
jgi:hypothetical protein